MQMVTKGLMHRGGKKDVPVLGMSVRENQSRPGRTTTRPGPQERRHGRPPGKESQPGEGPGHASRAVNVWLHTPVPTTWPLTDGGRACQACFLVTMSTRGPVGRRVCAPVCEETPVSSSLSTLVMQDAGCGLYTLGPRVVSLTL